MSLRVLIASAQKIDRDRIRAALVERLGVEVVAESADAGSALVHVAVLRPDVVVVEPRLFSWEIAQAVRRIVVECPTVHVVAVSVDPQFPATRVFRSAAAEGPSWEEHLEGIERVVYSVLQARANALADAAFDRELGAPAPSVLSRREREVLKLMSDGCTTKDSAERLTVSAKTVESHRRNLMNKLGIFSIAKLTKYAIRAGIASVYDDD